jgi:hypothetical protein
MLKYARIFLNRRTRALLDVTDGRVGPSVVVTTLAEVYRASGRAHRQPWKWTVTQIWSLEIEILWVKMHVLILQINPLLITSPTLLHEKHSNTQNDPHQAPGILQVAYQLRWILHHVLHSTLQIGSMSLQSLHSAPPWHCCTSTFRPCHGLTCTGSDLEQNHELTSK